MSLKMTMRAFGTYAVRDNKARINEKLDEIQNTYETEKLIGILSKAQCADELIISFKVKSSIKQDMPKKPIKRDISAKLDTSQDNTGSSEDTFLDMDDETLVPSNCEQEDIPPTPVRSIRQRKRRAAGPGKEQWKVAVAEGLKSFKDNDAWELKNASRDGRVIQCK
ncbi:hypothetical protein EVAR_48160_1 [Eumeta japonica]|uniref:Retrovirus-related Pol polyprotein from transposon TNT 1-94 n=1 Tax=Eumeta variegata TaxID=151549 RepID=A0A4C1WPV5_EUMVA|nr:hypothetical protein EVAR_48160_1 [Eumeta japonica]